MGEDLQVDLPTEARRLLRVMAEAGVVGGTEAEVAAYLVVRGLDDMIRAGVLKLGGA